MTVEVVTRQNEISSPATKRQDGVKKVASFARDVGTAGKDLISITARLTPEPIYVIWKVSAGTILAVALAYRDTPYVCGALFSILGACVLHCIKNSKETESSSSP